jgi:hypothetical protein
MSMDMITKRVEMSLSMTVANEVVVYLSNLRDLDTLTLAKMGILFTFFLIYIDSSWVSQINTDRKCVVKLLSITRQISILGVARLVLHK